MNSVADIWKIVLSRLSQDLSETTISTWFDEVEAVSIKDRTLYLHCPNDFKRSTIESMFSDRIKDSLRDIYSADFDVKLLSTAESTALFEPEVKKSTALLDSGEFTFDTFVVGNSNRFAHAASLAVAEAPGEAYNPLFLYGGVGLGKTHLMHAIGHYIQQQFPAMRLLYLSSETFTNELIQAIKNNKNVEFRNRFRNVDVLMVDDIQFIAGRESTQEEFFHTFNALHGAGKQIIISSDKPPKEIARLEERLRSRFEWGLIADIQKPDIETRVAILRKKAESERIAVDDEVLELIAARIESNIRELEGALTRVIAYASLTGRSVDVSLASEALRDILSVRDPKRITCELIQQAVAEYYGVSVQDIVGQKRKREIALPRQVAIYLTREMTEMSLPRIGDSFKRDHSTIMHSCDKIAEMVKTSSEMANTIDDLKKSIQEK